MEYIYIYNTYNIIQKNMQPREKKVRHKYTYRYRKSHCRHRVPGPPSAVAHKRERTDPANE